MAVELQGQQLWGGEYEIRERVAQGGMATVFTAYARSLDTIVAIKVLSARLAQDPAFRQRFHAEATNIAALHHPNIIEVHHFGGENDAPYIAMRYAPGGTLKDRLKETGGMMDLNSAARLTVQVASALHYAHNAGLIHLDVKPANILLGGVDWPLLSDFGIVRIAGEAREDGHRVAGTPAYMSPEQWQGLALDGRSDQYSLALMFYEIVTGRRPFSGETSAELKEQHVNEPPPRLRDLNPGVPGPVEDVVMRALSKDPDGRFPTIDEFGTALTEAVEHSRGMQLETKQAIVSAAPNLVALLVLSVVAPLLSGLPNSSAPIFHQLTLNSPIALVTALLQVWLLLGIRWHLIGIITRFLGAVLDGLDQFTRTYVRLGTDSQGPLRVKVWRNAAVGSAEVIVNIAYLFLIYRILGQPLVETIARLLTMGQAEALTATGVAVLTLLFAAAIVFRVYRKSGAIVAVLALAICWGLVSSMPIVDMEVYGGLSLQWLVKLAVGVAVLVAFFAVRGKVQAEVRAFIVPLVQQPLGGLKRVRSAEEPSARGRIVGRAADGLVNVFYLIVGYPIIATPLRRVLEGLVSERVAAVLITLVVALIVALLVLQLRAASGVFPATLGLLLSAPLLMALPLFEEGFLGGTSLQWAANLIIALGVLAIFLSIRRQVQAAARGVIVPTIDHQLSGLLTASSESQAEARHRALESASDMLVNVMYLLLAYFAAVRPVVGMVSDVTNLTWVSVLVYATFLAAALLVFVSFVRRLLPIVRPPSQQKPDTAQVPVPVQQA